MESKVDDDETSNPKEVTVRIEACSQTDPPVEKSPAKIVETEPDSGLESEEESASRGPNKKRKNVKSATNASEPRVIYVYKNRHSPKRGTPAAAREPVNTRKTRRSQNFCELPAKRSKNTAEPKQRPKESMRDLRLQWPSTTADLQESKATTVKPLKRCCYCLITHFESWRLRLHIERDHALEIQGDGPTTAWKKVLNLSGDGGRIIEALRVKQAMVAAKCPHYLLDGLMPIVKRVLAEALVDIGDETQRPGTRHLHWRGLYNDMSTEVRSSTTQHGEGIYTDEDPSDSE